MKLDVSIRIAPVFSLLVLSACGSDAAQSPGQGETTSLAAAANEQAASTVAPSGTAGMSSSKRASTTPPTASSTTTTQPAGSSTKAGAAGASASDSTAAIAGSGQPAAAGSGASTTGAAGQVGTQMQAPAMACNAAAMEPAAKPVDVSSYTDMGGALTPTKGPEKVVVEVDPGLGTHTIYRPETFVEGKKYPIVVWANGGCGKDGLMFARFLLEIASHGFVIVAWGTPNGTGMGELTTNGVPQTEALDWITKEAERPCSKYYGKVDTSKIAAMGQSCGGLMTFGVSGDKRLSTVVIWNSGMFERDQKIYAGLHAPMAFFIGGPDDVAYAQAEDDFAAINTVPVWYGNLPVGHFATYSQANGGEFGRVGIGWLKWQLYGDEAETGGKMFKGADCSLCKGTEWKVQKKMMD